ncbi:pancreatic lipase-related protein 2-like [Planococcus citri]|uniref:pancreatic lipase-related protein 2-like n=1 Tax=Planococcus citri TaxID=170843 RepID=UPI0031F7FC7F
MNLSRKKMLLSMKNDNQVKPALLVLFFFVFALNDEAAGGIIEWNQLANKVADLLPFLVLHNNETRCYGEVGCLNITRDWYGFTRWANTFPIPPQLMNTQFILFTRKNPSKGAILNLSSGTSLDSSNFDANNPTKIIIYGLFGSTKSAWITDMISELLKHGDYNVIVVDYDLAALIPDFFKQVANARLLGLQIGYFVNYLVDNYGVDPKSVHIIGHSVGAQVAAYAGNVIKNLGRISGLDPAVFFYHGMDPLVRLDSSDADFVDAIHTNGIDHIFLGEGISDLSGHVDFYVNGGKNQPGCQAHEQGDELLSEFKKHGLREAISALTGCEHLRSAKLFVDSINNNCTFTGYRCSSYERFEEGGCFSCEGNSSCAVMGFNADQNTNLVPGGRYFIDTGSSLPYCRQHYKVTLNLALPPEAESWVMGLVKVLLHTTNDTIEFNLTPEGSLKFGHGTSPSFIVTHPQQISNVSQIVLQWNKAIDILHPENTCVFWCNDHLYVKSITVETSDLSNTLEKIEGSNMAKLCSNGATNYADIPSGSKAIFNNTCADNTDQDI